MGLKLKPRLSIKPSAQLDPEAWKRGSSRWKPALSPIRDLARHIGIPEGRGLGASTLICGSFSGRTHIGVLRYSPVDEKGARLRVTRLVSGKYPTTPQLNLHKHYHKGEANRPENYVINFVDLARPDTVFTHRVNKVIVKKKSGVVTSWVLELSNGKRFRVLSHPNGFKSAWNSSVRDYLEHTGGHISGTTKPHTESAEAFQILQIGHEPLQNFLHSANLHTPPSNRRGTRPPVVVDGMIPVLRDSGIDWEGFHASNSQTRAVLFLPVYLRARAAGLSHEEITEPSISHYQRVHKVTS